jgi:hypothetical protein
MSSRLKTAVVTAVAVAALGAGVSSAAIPDGNGVISACYDKVSGQARLYDSETGSPKGCGPKEKTLAWNQAGVQGPAGPQGPQGEPGPSGVSGAEIVSEQSDSNSTDVRYVAVGCPAGKVLVGGGAQAGVNASGKLAIVNSSPLDNLAGWAARAEEVVPTDEDWSLTVRAICVDAP